MPVKITEDMHKTFADNGFTEDDITHTVNHYRAQGQSDEEIFNNLNDKYNSFKNTSQHTFIDNVKDIGGKVINKAKSVVENAYNIPFMHDNSNLQTDPIQQNQPLQNTVETVPVERFNIQPTTIEDRLNTPMISLKKNIGMTPLEELMYRNTMTTRGSNRIPNNINSQPEEYEPTNFVNGYSLKKANELAKQTFSNLPQFKKNDDLLLKGGVFENNEYINPNQVAPNQQASDLKIDNGSFNFIEDKSTELNNPENFNLSAEEKANINKKLGLEDFYKNIHDKASGILDGHDNIKQGIKHLARAGIGTYTSAYDMLYMLGDRFNNDNLRNFAKQGYLVAQHLQNLIQTDENSEGLKDFFKHPVRNIMNLTADSTPLMGMAIGGSIAAGGMAAAMSAPVWAVTLVSSAAAWAINSVLQGDYIEKKKEMEAQLGRKLNSSEVDELQRVTGVEKLIVGGLETCADMLGMGKFIGSVDKGVTNSLKNIVKKSLEQALEEGTTEGLQELTSVLAEKSLDVNQGNNFKRVLEATVSGGLLGGVMGGTGALFNKKVSKNDNKSDNIVENIAPNVYGKIQAKEQIKEQAHKEQMENLAPNTMAEQEVKANIKEAQKNGTLKRTSDFQKGEIVRNVGDGEIYEIIEPNKDGIGELRNVDTGEMRATSANSEARYEKYEHNPDDLIEVEEFKYNPKENKRANSDLKTQQDYIYSKQEVVDAYNEYIKNPTEANKEKYEDVSGAALKEFHDNEEAIKNGTFKPENENPADLSDYPIEKTSKLIPFNPENKTINGKNRTKITVEDLEKVDNIDAATHHDMINGGFYRQKDLQVENAEKVNTNNIVDSEDSTENITSIKKRKEVINNLFNENATIIEKEPQPYTGKRNISAVLEYLGSNNSKTATIKTPVEDVIFNENNLSHLINDNNSERLQDLNKAVRTLQEPNLVVNKIEEGKNYNYYIKTFKGNDKVKAHLQIVKKCDDGSFYVTNYSAKTRKLSKVLDNGNIIYKMSDGEQKIPANNIIPQNEEKITGINNNQAENTKTEVKQKSKQKTDQVKSKESTSNKASKKSEIIEKKTSSGMITLSKGDKRGGIVNKSTKKGGKFEVILGEKYPDSDKYRVITPTYNRPTFKTEQESRDYINNWLNENTDNNEKEGFYIPIISDLIDSYNYYSSVKDALKSGISIKELVNNHIFQFMKNEIADISDYTIAKMPIEEQEIDLYGEHLGKRKLIWINMDAINALPNEQQTANFLNTLRHEIEHALQTKQFNDLVKDKNILSKDLKVFRQLAEELNKKIPLQTLIKQYNQQIEKIAFRRGLTKDEVQQIKDYAELKVVNNQRVAYNRKHRQLINDYQRNTKDLSETEIQNYYDNLSNTEKEIIDEYIRLFKNYENSKYETNARDIGKQKAEEIIKNGNIGATSGIASIRKEWDVRAGRTDSSKTANGKGKSKKGQNFTESEASEKINIPNSLDTNTKQRGAIDTLGKYDKKIADAITDREYTVRGRKKIIEEINNMSEKEIADILNSDTLNSDVQVVVLGQAIKNDIKNGNVPVNKLNKWAVHGTTIGQEMEARKIVAPESVEEAVIKMYSINTSKAPAAAKKLLAETDNIVKELTNEEINKEFEEWLKSQDKKNSHIKQYSQDGDRLALLKAMEHYRQRKAVQAERAEQNAITKLEKQKAKEEAKKQREEEQAIKKLEQEEERKRKTVEKLVTKHTFGLGKKKRADLIDNILKLKTNDGLTADNVCKLINKMYGIKDISIKDIEELEKLADKIQNATSQREKDISKAYMQKYVLDNSDSVDWWDRLNAIRYINMLGGTKQRILDFVSTGVYQVVRLGDNFATLVLDTVGSKLTGGERVTSGLYFKEWGNGFVQGIKEGVYDTIHGINTGRAGETARYDLNKPNAFRYKQLKNIEGKLSKIKQGAENTASVLEKIVSGMVKVPDRAFFNARYNSSLIDILGARGVKLDKFTHLSGSELAEALTNEATEEEVEQALLEARENVYQRECMASEWAKNIRSAFNFGNKIEKKAGHNVLGVKLLNIGDWALPFIHTTSVISEDIIDRIGVGYIKGISKIIDINQNGGSKSQMRDAYNSIAKSIIGSLLIFTGIAMGSKKDEDSTDREISGLHKNSIKIGDNSYNAKDIPSILVPVNLGRLLMSNNENKIFKAIIETSNAIAEQNPVLSKYNEISKTAYKNKSEGDMLIDFIASSLGVPVAQLTQNAQLRNIREITDPYERETYEKGHPYKTQFNRFKNATPGLSNSLPIKYNAIGKPVMKNNIKNTAERIISATVTGHRKYTPDETYNRAKDEVDIMKSINIKNKNSIPFTKINRTTTVNGEKYVMNAEEYSEFQKAYGMINYKIRKANEEMLRATPDIERLKEYANIRKSADEAIRIRQLGHIPPKYKNGTYKLQKYTLEILQNYDKFFE